MSISDAVEAEIMTEFGERSMPGGRVSRLQDQPGGGQASRPDVEVTAVAVADQLLADLAAAGRQPPTEALIATTFDFADALGMAAVAAHRGLPLLYVVGDGNGSTDDDVPQATCDWLEDNPTVTTLHLAGGTAAIGDNVKGELQAECAGADRTFIFARHAGAERVETSRQIAEQLFGDARNVAFARSGEWPDAVTGALLGVREAAPILLTRREMGVEDPLLEHTLFEYVCTRLPTDRRAFLLGGPAAVSGEKEVAVVDTLTRCPVGPSAAPPPAPTGLPGCAPGRSGDCQLPPDPDGSTEETDDSAMINDLLEAAGANTTVVFPADTVYEVYSPLEPLTGQRLVGQPGSVLSGTRHIGAWEREGDRWRAADQGRRFCVHGNTVENEPIVIAEPPGGRYPQSLARDYLEPQTQLSGSYAEDVYLDGVPLRQVGASVDPRDQSAARVRSTIQGLGSGEFLIEYDADHPRDQERRQPSSDENQNGRLEATVSLGERTDGDGCDNGSLDQHHVTRDRDGNQLSEELREANRTAYQDTIWVADDPAGKNYEVNIGTRAIFVDEGRDGGAVIGLTVRGFGTTAQVGAIDVTRAERWELSHLDVSLSHGAGVAVGANSALRHSRVHDNGELGVAASENANPRTRLAPGMVIEHNEIASNNWAGFSCTWECGGAKMTLSDGLMVRRNWSHHNVGPGFWTDIETLDTAYSENLLSDNTRAGIKHEISFDAIIRGNTAAYNGSLLYPQPNRNLQRDRTASTAGIFISVSRNVRIEDNIVRFNRYGILATHNGRGRDPAGPYPGFSSQHARFHLDNVSVTRNVDDPTGPSGNVIQAWDPPQQVPDPEEPSRLRDTTELERRHVSGAVVTESGLEAAQQIQPNITLPQYLTPERFPFNCNSYWIPPGEQQTAPFAGSRRQVCSGGLESTGRTG